MAGIEQAFKDFIKRVSNKERSPEEIPLDKYTPYTEQEILGNLESKYPNYSPPEYDSYETMPIYPPRDVIPKGAVPVMPEIMNRDRQYMDLADGGLSNLIKNNIGPEYRLYTRTMVPGLKTGKLDENYFPDDFKLDLRRQALEKYSRTGDLSGQVNEKDQHLTRSSRQNAITKFPSTYATLGTYSYEIDPKTLDVKVKDKYDWNPAYGTQGNFTGWIGNDNPKARDVDTSLIKDYISNSFKNKRVDTSAGLEMLGNLLGPRASKGEGVDIDINIPTEFAAMRADTPYADGGRINYSSGSGLPPVEEDQSEQLFGQNIQTVPTGFNFAVNRPMPVYQEGQPNISGGLRDLRNYVNSTMGNINPQLNYTDNNFGGNVSAMMNPFTNMPKSYSADAYYGPEQGRFNVGFTTVPTADARQLRAGYEGPYGNISLGASRDPSGNNYMLNYSNSFADGGYISQGEPVDTDLTRTIPPDSGPNPQGVETLFKRRYN
jgi:hypothetical protein